MTTWTEASPSAATYAQPPGNTTWDDGDTLWDVNNANIATTRWDVNTTRWTAVADPDTTWTDA